MTVEGEQKHEGLYLNGESKFLYGNLHFIYIHLDIKWAKYHQKF